MSPADAVGYLMTLPDLAVVTLLKGLDERAAAKLLAEFAGGTEQETGEGGGGVRRPARRPARSPPPSTPRPDGPARPPPGDPGRLTRPPTGPARVAVPARPCSTAGPPRLADPTPPAGPAGLELPVERADGDA